MPPSIDKKSLFGTPRSASAHTGRNHAGTRLTQRLHAESVAKVRIQVKSTTKQWLKGYSLAAQKPPGRVLEAGMRQTGPAAMDHLFA
jgi:hypothetical protein